MLYQKKSIPLSPLKVNDVLATQFELKRFSSSTDLTTLPKLDEKELDKLRKQFQLNDKNLIEPSQLLKLAPINKQFYHSYAFRFMLFAYFNGLSIDEYLSWYSQKNTTPKSYI